MLAIIARFQERGVAVYKERVEQIGQILDAQIADIVARAKVLTGNEEFNIASPGQVGRAVYAGEYRSRGVGGNTKTTRLKKSRRYKQANSTVQITTVAKAQALIAQLKLELGV